MIIPNDPFMLLSMVNMKLRDGDYESPEVLCESLGIKPEELYSRLEEAGFSYMKEINQFR